jgi:2-methylcitrate dehydratase PrpD
MASATRAVVRAAREAALDPLPDEVSTVARQCLLDWLGVALAGASEPLVGMLVDELIGESSSPQATLVGRGQRAAAPDAALINGAAAHALDYDDTHLAMMGHATVPVAAAVAALGERRQASGAQVISALVAGIEAECRIGLLVSPSHYGRGWHATGTLGTFGAAAGCAALLGLDEDVWLQAFGIAGTQASGLKAVFGTMCKPLHAGKAAAGGMLAATLAARGFTSRTDILEAHQGFAATHADRLAGSETLEAVAGRYLIRDTLFKYHAACYLTHGAIDSVLRLREHSGLAPADVGEVEVRVSREVLDVANISEPSTGLEGKFSLRAATAMALLGDDTADPEAYTDARMAAPDLVAMRDRVHVVADSEGAPAVATATIRTAAGDELRETTDAGVPAADLALQGDRLEAKFMTLAGRRLGARRAGELRDIVERLDSLESVAELTAACRS